MMGSDGDDSACFVAVGGDNVDSEESRNCDFSKALNRVPDADVVDEADNGSDDTLEDSKIRSRG